jgi:hypothetical protein
MFTFRYHVISLIAVFLALGVGVLLGASIGGDSLSGAQKKLESSLRGDLRDARGKASDLQGEVGVRDEFERQAYPILVKDLLPGFRIGVVAVGDLPPDYASRVRDAVQPAGAEIDSISVVRSPLPLGRIAGDVKGTSLEGLDQDGGLLSRFGERLGRQLVNGGSLVGRVKRSLFSSSRGQYRGLDGIVLVRDREGLKGDEKRAEDRLESGLLSGLRSTDAAVVGVETRSTDPSQVPFMADHGLSTVDDLDLVAGRAALIFTLLGADGHFGVKQSADQLLPPLPVEGPARR